MSFLLHFILGLFLLYFGKFLFWQVGLLIKILQKSVCLILRKSETHLSKILTARKNA